MFNYCFGQCGFDLYAEIHQNYYNKVLHGIFMPVLVYGVFLGLPALLNLFQKSAHHFLMAVYLTYFVYYMSFDLYGALASAVVYYAPFMVAVDQYYWHVTNRWATVRSGLKYIAFAVIVQEIFGHTLFEEANSDLMQLPNSLMIAPIFGARSLLHMS